MREFRPTSFNILPTIIKNLIIINALMFLAQNTFAGPTSSGLFCTTRMAKQIVSTMADDHTYVLAWGLWTYTR